MSTKSRRPTRSKRRLPRSDSGFAYRLAELERHRAGTEEEFQALETRLESYEKMEGTNHERITTLESKVRTLEDPAALASLVAMGSPGPVEDPKPTNFCEGARGRRGTWLVKVNSNACVTFVQEIQDLG